jgi:hypothetical protein
MRRSAWRIRQLTLLPLPENLLRHYRIRAASALPPCSILTQGPFLHGPFQLYSSRKRARGHDSMLEFRFFFHHSGFTESPFSS